MFSGSLTALITPFRDGRIDTAGLTRNIEFQLAHGTSGLVPCGTTGESPTLTHEEWQEVIRTTVSAARKLVPVVAGTGANDTRKTIALTQEAEQLGADGALVVSPYYNKPTQEGLFRHFRAVCESVRIPIVIYNIPGRTGVNILPETIERIAQACPNFTAVKEATGSIDQASDILLRCGKQVSVLSGDDSLTLPILAVGGRGVISVISNIVPRDVAELCRLYLAGDAVQALALHRKLLPLTRAMFVETNPIPVKTAMNMLAMPAGELRLPLCEPSEPNRQRIAAALKDYGLL
jgi:4-hydroxy-tetrahydrodipicolinate synthase